MLNYLFFSVNTLKYLVESNLFVFSHRFLINGLNLFLDIIIPLFYKY